MASRSIGAINMQPQFSLFPFPLFVFLLRVVPTPRLHNQVLLLRQQMNLAVVSAIGRFFRNVTQYVLSPQLLRQLIVNLIHRLLLRNFEHSPARFLRNSFENFLSIRPLFLLRVAMPASAAMSAPASAAVSPSWTKRLVILEQNRINHRVRALC